MQGIRLGAISFDCAEPAVLGEFWAALAGGTVSFSREDLSVVRLDNGVLITAMRVEPYVPPSWPAGVVPKQLHLDLAVDDLDAAVSAATSLGASLASTQPDSATHRVLIDPAGHPFCVSRAANFVKLG